MKKIKDAIKRAEEERSVCVQQEKAFSSSVRAMFDAVKNARRRCIDLIDGVGLKGRLRRHLLNLHLFF